MCIAIVKPQGTEISDEYLKNCFENNSDGAGIAYAKGGKLYIIKGIFHKNNFIKAVRKAETLAEGDMLIHCRIGTSGKKNKGNCHPHIVNNSVVMIHNGILDIDVPLDSKVSDTIIFIQEYLKDLPKDFIKNKAIIKLIEKNIGTYNKFAFLNNQGESVICNPQEGIFENGIWYSNNTYMSGWNYFHKKDAGLFDYFEDYISCLDDEDFEFLGDYPLIDKESYELVPYNISRDGNERYISLQECSQKLYNTYLNKFWDNYQNLFRNIA